MRALWLLTLLVAGALADHHEHDDDCDCPGGRRWGSIAAKAQAQEADLNRVAGRIEALAGRLQAHIDTFKSKMYPDFRDMEFRVREIQGNGCEERHYQCGGDEPRCISDLMVCDGSPDCPNGSDEDDDSCHSPIPAGSKFVGLLNPDHNFCTSRKATERDLIIESVERSNIFPARLKVRASMHIKYKAEGENQEDVLPLKGYYNFGTHELYFAPPEANGYALTCRFRIGNDDRCLAAIVHELSHNHCGDDFVFIREDH